MDSSYDLPNEIADQLLCFICGKYLSCGPIKEENGNFICGRCNPSDLNTTAAHIAFTKILKSFTFPCQYDKQGCEERLLFNSNIQHEDSCHYRTLRCPVNSCTSLMLFSEFYEHFEESHSHLIISDNQFKLNLEEDSCGNYLMVQENFTIVFKYSYNSLNKCLQLNVENEPIENCLVYYRIQILNALDSYNNINLSEQQCSVYAAPEMCEEMAVMLAIEKYLFTLNNPSAVIFKIFLNNSIVTDVKQHFENLSISRYCNDNLEQQMTNKFTLLESVRCAGCCRFIAPPQYLTKHYAIKCNECQPNRSRVTYNIVHNYPCRWRRCKFLGTSENITEHVETCKFKTRICPYYSSCKKGIIKFNTSLIEHVKTHAKYCSNPQKITIQLFNNKKSTSEVPYFTILNETVVKFTVTINGDNDWRISVTLPANIILSMFFIHAHCRYVSKTLSFTGPMEVNCTQASLPSNVPTCFEECYRLTAVLCMN